MEVRHPLSLFDPFTFHARGGWSRLQRGGGSGRGEGPGAAPWGLRSAPARTRPCQVSESIGSQGSRRGRVVWSAHCSWRYAVSFSSWVLNHLALFILDICCVEFWKSLLLLELRMRVFEVFLQSWNISSFVSVFSPYKFGLAIRITPSILGEHSDFFLVWFIYFLARP